MKLLKIASISDIGLVRAENQDIVLTEDINDNILVVLCDGMGGERSGMDASRITAEIVLSKFILGYKEIFDSNNIRNLLISSVNAANSVVYKTSQTNIEKMGMGTTCVVAFVTQNGIAHIINVGDSRAYLIKDGKMNQITIDHNVAQMLLLQGKINQEEAKVHPHRNMLIKAVGVEKEINPDYFEVNINEGEKILMCSDGLSGYSSEEEIIGIINTHTIDESINKLVNLANEKGGKDNITIALIEY